MAISFKCLKTVRSSLKWHKGLQYVFILFLLLLFVGVPEGGIIENNRWLLDWKKIRTFLIIKTLTGEIWGRKIRKPIVFPRVLISSYCVDCLCCCDSSNIAKNIIYQILSATVCSIFRSSNRFLKLKALENSIKVQRFHARVTFEEYPMHTHLRTLVDDVICVTQGCCTINSDVTES